MQCFMEMGKCCVYVEAKNTGVSSCRNLSLVMRRMQMVRLLVMWYIGSKNCSGSHKDKMPNKIAKHYANPALKERYVFLLRL